MGASLFHHLRGLVTWPTGARDLVLTLGQEHAELDGQFTTVATKLPSLRERIGFSSRNSSMPATNNGPVSITGVTIRQWLLA
jgi:hypothetical protein